MLKVCLDPGHNEIGADTGASNKDLLEQVLTLKIARMVRKGLEAQGQFSVIMTRDGQTVNGPSATQLDSLRTRCRIANEANADLFVSIHVNAGGGTGSEVLIYGKGGKAEKCANILAPLIAEAGDWYNRGVKVQNVHVLRETNMPAVLTENGFIDHEMDHARLQMDFWLNLIADAHVLGICEYFGVPYKPYKNSGTAPAAPGSSITPAAPVDAMLPALIVYFGEPEERIVPYLQEKLKAPAIRLGILTLKVAEAAAKIYGVGGSAAAYVVDGKQIPLFQLIAGYDQFETADKVIQSVKGGAL